MVLPFLITFFLVLLACKENWLAKKKYLNEYKKRESYFSFSLISFSLCSLS